jgi:hypothetical protein
MTKLSITELYDLILTQMSAEDALMRLLEGHARTYEHLKFNEGEEINPLILISMAALDLGWGLGVPCGKEEDDVQGMIVGTQEYVGDILDEMGWENKNDKLNNEE